MGKGSLGTLYAELALKTKEFESGIVKSKKLAEKLNTDIENITDKINEKLKSIGVGLSAGVTLPLTIFGKQALDTFSNFQQSMQNTFSVMGATSAEMEALRKKAEEMGASTRFSASQASDALYNLGSAGQSASQAMSSLDGVLRLAGATGSDLAFTSGTIASTLSQFNLEADKASHIADVYAMAISKSQANMTKLSYSMKYVGPVASGLNIKLETATAALMKLYNTGYGGEMAGTYLRAGLQKLASGTDDFKKKLESIGLTYDEVNPKTNNFADIIDRLKEKQVDINKANELFGDIAGGAMSKLIEGGGEAIRTMDGLLQASDGAAQKMQDIQNASFANTKAELASAFEAVQITLVSNVIPAVNIFAQGITNALKFINELPVGVQTAGTAFAGLAAAAGPLLLVAVGVKKIKQEMIQLNMVAAANPIMAWGAAIAGVAAIATGIIAQLRKSQEDYIHGAKRSLDEIKKMQNEALTEGNKGRKINALLDEYETLKNKTSLAADEQERYNNLIEELKTLSPDVVVKLNEQSRAFIENAEKVREAAEKSLQTEQALNKMALAEAELRAVQASSVVEKYQDKLPEQKEAVEQITQKLTEATDMYRIIKVKHKEWVAETAKGNKEIALQIQQELTKMANSPALPKELDIYNSLNPHDVLDGFKKYHDYVFQKSQKIEEKYKEMAEAVRENKEAQEELNEVKQKGILIAKGLGDLANNKTDQKEEPVKSTQKEKLLELQKEWNEYQEKGIQIEAKLARAQGENFDINAKKAEWLKKHIRQLLDIPADSIDKKFTPDTKGLQSFIDLLWKFKELSEQTKKNDDNNLKGFAKYAEEQKKLREELEKTQDEIQKTKELLASDEKLTQLGQAILTPEERELHSGYLKEQEERLDKINMELGNTKYSLSEIDSTIKELENSGKSKYQLRLIDIEAEKNRIDEVIDAAVKAQKITEEKAKELKEKNKENEKKAQQEAAVQTMNPYLQGAIGIAQSLTNVIANAIEQGGVDGLSAIAAAGDIIGQIGNMVGNSIAKAVLGSISAAVGMTTKILGAFQNKAKKATQEAREDAQKFNDEIKRQQEENIRNAASLTGEVVKNISKATASKKLDANTIFDTQSLEIEKKRIDEVLNGIKDLKTEATYTYQQKRTRKIDKWWDPLDWFHEEETYFTTEMANYNVAQVMEKYNEAMRKGDYELAKKWKDFAQKAIEKGLKDAGVNVDNVDSISNYMNGLDNALGEYVKTRDMKSFKKALQDQLYEALVNKAVASTISKRIAQVFDNIDTGKITYEEGLKKIESIGDEAGKIFDDMNKRFGLTATQAKKEWEQVGASISSALSSALGDAAYNADWGSFKKSFATEMKKAIIQSAIESAGVKKKVDEIIKEIMDDGKISGDEINDTINRLKDVYDNLEGNMAELAKINKALEGGVEIKSKTSGSIIQQLSGADRDWFMETLKEGFTKINQVIDLKETTIQHMAATQIIINSLIYNSYNSTIYIQATESTDLKGLIGEIVEQALAG